MRERYFCMRLTADELAAFDALAQANRTSRPGLIRRLLNLNCEIRRGRPSKAKPSSAAVNPAQAEARA
jgi:hypothetical protein